jgi:type IV pilus biogenesis protein CpaD/CtpE
MKTLLALLATVLFSGCASEPVRAPTAVEQCSPEQPCKKKMHHKKKMLASKTDKTDLI